MKKFYFLVILVIVVFAPSLSQAKELPKIAVWDLVARNTPATHAQELTSILVSEINKLEKYEVYSQDHVRAVAGWTEQRMKLGCTDTQCLTALGQMDIAKLISGSVGKIGDRYSISLSLFDTRKTRAENAISEFCSSENELIELVQFGIRKLLGDQTAVAPAPKAPERTATAAAVTDPVTGLELVLIPAGSFVMGSPADETGRWDKDDREGPQHQVEITRAFYLGKHEVTVGQFRKFVQDAGYKTEAETGGGAYSWTGSKWEKKEGIYWDNPGFSQTERHPVTCVSWNDAQAFIRWLNRKTGRSYRLPTEAEWEYAARAGTKTARYWGENPDQACQFANVADRTAKKSFPGWTTHECDDGYVYTAPVGSFRPNAFGLYDMLGNVWEWCEDWFDKDYYKNSPVQNPTGPSSSAYRVLRGGSWDYGPRYVRAAYRLNLTPDRRLYSIGFRLAGPK